MQSNTDDLDDLLNEINSALNTKPQQKTNYSDSTGGSNTAFGGS